MNPVRPEKIKFMLMASNMNRAVKFYRDVIGLGAIFAWLHTDPGFREPLG